LKCKASLGDHEKNVDLLRQVLTFFGFSRDDDPNSIFNIVNKPKIFYTYDEELSYYFSQRDIDDIDRVYHLCDNIVRKEYPEPDNSFQWWWIVMGVCLFGLFIVAIVQLYKYCLKRAKNHKTIITKTDTGYEITYDF